MSDFHSELIRQADAIRFRIREVPAAEALLCSGRQLIDVRTPEEFARGHLAGAINLPRERLDSEIGALVPDLSTPVLVYCAGGNRGALAADFLQARGYREVASIAGGLKACPLSALSFPTPTHSATSLVSK